MEDRWKSIKRHIPDEVHAALANEEVTDIHFNPNGTVFATGFCPKELICTMQEDKLTKFIKQTADYVRETVTEDGCLVSGYIKDERLRIEGTVFPASLSPGLTMRKLATKMYNIESYIESGILEKEGAEILETAISNYANIVVAGATGTGKTTLVNSLLDKIGELCPTDRVLTIEDTQELIVPVQDQWQHFTTSTVDATEHVRRMLRKSPKRVIVGETRDATIIDILNIWNTGHSGGLTTLHAGRTPWKSFKNISESDMTIDVLERIEDMAALAITVTNQFRRTIAKSVDLVVSIERYSFEEARKRSGKTSPGIGDQINVTSISELEYFDTSVKDYVYKKIYNRR